MAAVPYFAGLMAGETEALIHSFDGEPELHHPVRGRIKGAPAFEAFVMQTNAWLAGRNVVVNAVDLIVTERRTVEEVALQLDGEHGRVELPMAIVTEREANGRLNELRIYHSTWPLTGLHANRPPLLQPNPAVHAGDSVGDYQHALAAGDVDRIVATFEPDGYAREPAGGQYVYRGPQSLQAFYNLLFSNGGPFVPTSCRTRSAPFTIARSLALAAGRA